MAKNKVITKENYNEYVRVYLLKTSAYNRLEVASSTRELFSIFGIICAIVSSAIASLINLPLMQSFILLSTPLPFIIVPSINIKLIKNELKKALEEIKMENSQIDIDVSIDTLRSELENEEVLDGRVLAQIKEEKLSTNMSIEQQLATTIKKYDSYISSTLKEENNDKNKVKVKTMFKR